MKIEIKELSKSYIKDNVKVDVLKGINAEFETGKLYCIIGKSGNGKSTFLKCMSAILPIDEGSIIINDKNLQDMSGDELANLRNEKIGYIFQEYNLLDFLNAYENVILPLVINGKENFSNDINKDVLDIIKYVEMEKRLDHFPSELSGGEQQRIAIARALVNDPDIILCDEPTGSIDYDSKIKVIELLKNISKKKCVIVVTHDTEWLNYADIIYKMEKGKLVNYEVEK